MNIRSFILLAVCGSLTGCFSHTRNIDFDPQYSHFMNKTVVTTKELRLYQHPKHQYLFSEYGLSAWKTDDSRYSKFLEVLPLGSTLRIVEARRKFDRYGTCDYVFGDYASSSLEEIIRFEFMVTAIEKKEGALPFKLTTNK